MPEDELSGGVSPANGENELFLSRRERRERERAAQEQRASAESSSRAEASGSAASESPALEDLFPGTEGSGAAPTEKKRRFSPGCLIGLLLVGLLIGGAVVGWNMFGDRVMSLFPQKAEDYEGAGNGEVVDFSIIEGDTGTSIGERLHEAGIVKSTEAFVDEVTSRADEPQFHPGSYEMQKEMSAKSALDYLLNDANRQENMVMIPEGALERDVFALIESNIGVPASELEALASKPQEFGLPPEATSLEGYLFPATYKFEPGTNAEQILKTMVDRTFQAFDEHGVPKDRQWEVIRMASLLEKEARNKDDFYKVARVFYNRIDIDMPLQSDATVLYWTEGHGTEFDLNDASNPYNTYVHQGLTPGPISNPGDLAIDAAMHPVDGDWLYFVTVNYDTGETIFNRDYEEHLKAVEQWKKWMKDNNFQG